MLAKALIGYREEGLSSVFVCKRRFCCGREIKAQILLFLKKKYAERKKFVVLNSVLASAFCFNDKFSPQHTFKTAKNIRV